MASNHHWLKKILFFVPVAAGVAIFIFAVKSKAPPPRTDITSVVQKVRVVTAKSLDVVPVTMVYGNAMPERTWDAIAEVAGQVVKVNPRLRDGNLVQKDTELLTVDPVGYELRVAEIDAQLAEIRIKEENTRTLLEIEKRNLALAEQSLSRKRGLMKKGATSRASVDQEEQATLVKRAAVQNLRNTLSLIPVQRRALETRLSQANRDLDHTTIRAPFDIRVADLNVETNQYVGIGQTLFRGDAIDRVEVIAQVPMDRMRPLLLGSRGPNNPPRKFLEAIALITQLTATVRLPLGDGHVVWPAKVVRFDDTIDTKTRTVGVVVAVDDPYENVEPGTHPPLVKGMFVKVDLKGARQPKSIVVPAQAVRQGAVYLISKGGVLETRPVSVRFYQGAAAILSEGVESGETVIVSDPVPAIDGMRVDGVADDDLAKRTEVAATGMDGAQ